MIILCPIADPLPNANPSLRVYKNELLYPELNIDGLAWLVTVGLFDIFYFFGIDFFLLPKNEVPLFDDLLELLELENPELFLGILYIKY